MTKSPHRDVVDMLCSQHEEIKQTLAEVRACVGPARATAFDRLRTLLHAHETGERQIVHPATRDFAGEGDIAGHRIAEEQQAAETLTRLTELGTDHPDFDSQFTKLRDAVLEHAEREEAEEFPQLRKALTADLLISLAERLRAVEARA